MKRALAAFMTVAIGAGVLWTGWRRNDQAAQKAPETALAGSQGGPFPRSNASERLAGAAERIEGLVDCARRGDVQGYLNSFSGPVRARLDQQVAERGWEAFAAELRRSGQVRKSYAVFAAEPAGAAPESARVTVETTFTDRIERQTYYLEVCGAGWLVTEIERVRDRVPKNPLGSWATYQEPEGQPVPTASTAEDENPENH